MKSIQWNSSMRFFTRKILAQCVLFSFKRHKKNIIHIRLPRLTWWLTMDIRISKSNGYSQWKSSKTEYRLQKEQFPLENRIILVEILTIEIPKVSSQWNFKTNWMSIPIENSQSLFPLKLTKFVPTETKKKFSGKRSKTKKFRLVLTNQQTNEHLNKTHWDWFKFFNSYNLYTM